MDVPMGARRPLQEIGNRYLPAKLRHKGSSIAGSSSPAGSSLKYVSYPAAFECSSPPRSAPRSTTGFTSSPGLLSARASSIASSPPPATPIASPSRTHLSPSQKTFLTALNLISNKAAIEHVELTESGQTVNISIGQTLHIGRKLKSVEDKVNADSNQNGTCIKLVTIPKAAKHASRHHCTVQLLQSGNQEGDQLRQVLKIDVLGQNGMQLNGTKIPKGVQELDVTSRKSARLGFFTDFDVQVTMPTVTAVEHVIPINAKPSAQAPDHPTSEATLGLDLDMDLECESDADGEEDEKEPDLDSLSVTSSPLSTLSSPPPSRKRPSSKQSERASSSAPPKRVRMSSEARSSPAPSPYAHQDDDGYPPESSSESEDEETVLRQKNALLEESRERVKTAVKTLSLDLIGILASGIVFQPRATLTTSECIHSLLETQPWLLAHGSEEAWRPSVLAALRSGPFGVIENEGLKDAAGKKVEPDWFYRPDIDKDTERKASLQPFVKSVRSTQREKKQYFFKRPSDLKHRRW